MLKPPDDKTTCRITQHAKIIGLNQLIWNVELGSFAYTYLFWNYTDGTDRDSDEHRDNLKNEY